MDLSVYKKTRYQNIYKHKNGNYVVMISKPVKSSISRINGEKIWKIEDALNIRDNQKIKLQKASEIKYKNDFDSLWYKYIEDCIYAKKLAYNTYHKKEKLYNKYIKGAFTSPLSKIKKQELLKFIDNLDTTNKQKNEITKIIKPFLNWCVENEIIIFNPLTNVKEYKVEKEEMDYWQPNELKQFLEYINNKFETSKKIDEKESLYRIKMFVLIGFILGDRPGETRALTFGSVNENKSQIIIKHSINYDPNSSDYLSSTKTYWSQREIDVSNYLIDEIKKYRYFLENEMCYNITNSTLIFSNFKTNKPFSDDSIRKRFKKYCIKAGVPYIKPYGLRHTYTATMMLEEKPLYAISSRLGHKNYSTTVNKYGHLSNNLRKEIAKTTDKYLL